MALDRSDLRIFYALPVFFCQKQVLSGGLFSRHVTLVAIKGGPVYIGSLDVSLFFEALGKPSVFIFLCV